MNLLGLASGVAQAANPNAPFVYYESTGYAPASKANSFVVAPAYAAPVALTGSVASGVLTASAFTQGKLTERMTLSGAGVPASVTVESQLTGPDGGPGTYQLAGPAPDLSSQAFTAALILMGNEQALQYRDLAQIDGLNLNGTRRKIYLFGVSDGVVRALGKGGDLLVDGYGRTWLVALVLEQYGGVNGWCCVAVSLQDGS